jgi:hypothetical protein
MQNYQFGHTAYQHTHTHMHTCIHACMHTCMHAFMHTCDALNTGANASGTKHIVFCVCLAAIRSSCIQVCVHVNLYKRMYVDVRSVYVSLWPLFIAPAYKSICMRGMCACVRIHMYVFMHVCTYVLAWLLSRHAKIWANMFKSLHTYTNAYIHTYIHTCMHTHKHTRTEMRTWSSASSLSSTLKSLYGSPSMAVCLDERCSVSESSSNARSLPLFTLRMYACMYVCMYVCTYA